MRGLIDAGSVVLEEYKGIRRDLGLMFRVYVGSRAFWEVQGNLVIK